MTSGQVQHYKSVQLAFITSRFIGSEQIVFNIQGYLLF